MQVLSTALIVFCLALTTDAQPISALGYPGNLFFASAKVNTAARADTLQKANSNFNNHVDSDSGNTGVAKSLVVNNNHASQSANDRGFSDATAKNDALLQQRTDVNSNGAVLSPWVRFLRGECAGGGCFGYGNGFGGGCAGLSCGGGVPSSLSAANKESDLVNKGGNFNEANVGRASDAKQRAKTQYVAKTDVRQEGYANANANSEANAHALNKGNFFGAQNTNQNQVVVANPGLFLRR
ncbi:hypothetical protein ACHHYP_01538 [Achlya hypogyna]|uniref:Secreted protein n=1 Tax=Achlya hypogyna TaxID=1202772 RepID=A0A0A7CMZ1_ACHHY|nr:secreted protein [Achlya hypogyna]OQR94292.1 hypothetical protein ACHHYP_01538 [Achlya hypogyna]